MNTTRNITIYIHGTLPPKVLLKVPLLRKFFYCPPGLHTIRSLDSSHVKTALTALCTLHPEGFPLEHCYAFGWEGALNHATRKQAALDLYKKIVALITQYREERITPKITLLTHSHGGNLALCLPYGIENHGETISIDTLILLACPVQAKTAEQSNHALFDNVYSIHSHRDLFQVLDPQGLHELIEYVRNFGLECTLSNLKKMGPLFSQRHFPLTSKALQLNVKYAHRELLHIEFLLPHFIEALPDLLSNLQQNSPSEGMQEHTIIFPHKKKAS